MELAQSELELLYMQKYSDTQIPEAYERLILDCINGGGPGTRLVCPFPRLVPGLLTE